MFYKVDVLKQVNYFVNLWFLFSWFIHSEKKLSCWNSYSSFDISLNKKLNFLFGYTSDFSIIVMSKEKMLPKNWIKIDNNHVVRMISISYLLRLCTNNALISKLFIICNRKLASSATSIFEMTNNPQTWMTTLTSLKKFISSAAKNILTMFT